MTAVHHRGFSDVTTSSNTTTLSHSNTTDFRIWGLEFSNMLTAAGFPKSADTGQINWASVTKSGSAGAYSGYEIRYLNDSLHGTYPIYVKIEYGNGASSAVYPSIRVSVASSTNGAGTLTGVSFLGPSILTNDAVIVAGARFSGAVTREGFAAFVWKRGWDAAGSPFFAICRTTDTSGTPTALGVSTYVGINGGTLVWRYTYINTVGTVDNEQYGYAFYPGLNGSLVSGAPQVFRHFNMTPEVQCVPFLLSYSDTEIGDLSTFTATPVGATQRTYLALSGVYGPANCGLYQGGVASFLHLAIQWE